MEGRQPAGLFLLFPEVYTVPMTKEKNVFRLSLKKCWDELSAGELASLSGETERTIAFSREWNKADTILAYLSFGKEISLDGLICLAIDEGKAVYVPLITGPGTMDFHRIDDLSDLKLNRWGIREPSPSSACFTSRAGGETLILTPGLGFSSDGRRMGRGGGYYDRFLSQKEKGMLSMGICWDGVLREDIPAADHDCPVDMICCENRILRP